MALFRSLLCPSLSDIKFLHFRFSRGSENHGILKLLILLTANFVLLRAKRQEAVFMLAELFLKNRVFRLIRRRVNSSNFDLIPSVRPSSISNWLFGLTEFTLTWVHWLTSKITNWLKKTRIDWKFFEVRQSHTNSPRILVDKKEFSRV